MELDAFLDELPPTDYFVWADSDEFFEYPCDMEELVARERNKRGREPVLA
eukprot:CAMPEP_0119378738 /NCGR_PEP_ID=MMETSP1334-20130426/49633_1 /TAXON_ID=127549 /ORGANISM="Calcidiscus leptoporus, Strain RCC1130" /LENGTH=49 /DNA_ID= /DNA_START= /DNA_END= /DNA_ORIENTATION=